MLNTPLLGTNVNLFLWVTANVQIPEEMENVNQSGFLSFFFHTNSAYFGESAYKIVAHFLTYQG